MDDWKMPTFSEEDINEMLNLVQTAKRQKRIFLITTISFIISFVASAAGIITLFTHTYPILYICAVFTIADSIIQVWMGQQKNFAVEILMVVIGIICALFGLSFWVSVSASLCIETALLSVISVPALIHNIKVYKNI